MPRILRLPKGDKAEEKEKRSRSSQTKSEKLKRLLRRKKAAPPPPQPQLRFDPLLLRTCSSYVKLGEFVTAFLCFCVSTKLEYLDRTEEDKIAASWAQFVTASGALFAAVLLICYLFHAREAVPKYLIVEIVLNGTWGFFSFLSFCGLVNHAFNNDALAVCVVASVCLFLNVSEGTQKAQGS